MKSRRGGFGIQEMESVIQVMESDIEEVESVIYGVKTGIQEVVSHNPIP